MATFASAAKTREHKGNGNTELKKFGYKPKNEHYFQQPYYTEDVGPLKKIVLGRSQLGSDSERRKAALDALGKALNFRPAADLSQAEDIRRVLSTTVDALAAIVIQLSRRSARSTKKDSLNGTADRKLSEMAVEFLKAGIAKNWCEKNKAIIRDGLAKIAANTDVPDRIRPIAGLDFTPA